MRLGTIEGEQPQTIKGERLTQRQKIEVAARKAVADTIRLCNEKIYKRPVETILNESVEATTSTYERLRDRYDGELTSWKHEEQAGRNPGPRPTAPRDERFAYDAARRAVELLKAGSPDVPAGDLDCFLR